MLRRSGPPTLTDPVVITVDDGTLFVAWVEQIGDGLRWVAVSTDRMSYNVGVYLGETTLEAMRARLSDWWRDRRARDGA